MKQIIITPVKENDTIVQVCITDDMRKNERNIFMCPLACVSAIVNSNINLKY